MRIKTLVLLLLVSALSGLFAQSSEDWYQNKPIRMISFEGLKGVEKSELDGLFGSYLGKPFSDERYWEILQKMYALEYFDEITPVALPADPERKTVNIQFTVKEKPLVRKIRFVGNKKIRATDLLEKVTLKEGDIYNELKTRVDERALRDHYFSKGYAAARLSYETASNKDGSLDIVYTIDEGKQTVISSIEFEGNSVMASKTLRGTLSLKEAKLFSSGTFSESALEADKNAIKSYYNERGYVDALVENVIREIDETDPEKNTLKLIFVVREGEQYTYGGTTVQGNFIFSTEELLGKIRLNSGDVMNLNRYNQGYQALADVYFENGYTSNHINRQEKRDAERKTVSYVITIVENDRSHVENIIIRGNLKTKDHVVLREFTFDEGDIFSKTKMISSIRNLYNLRYFSAVAPDIVQGSEQNLIDVIVNLEEQSTASIQFGVTFSGVTDTESFPLSVFVQWEDKNFMGNGQTLSANLTASTDTQSLTLGFAENWFLGSPLTVSFNFTIAHKFLYAYQDVLYPVFDDDYYKDNGIVPDPFTSLEEYEDASRLDKSFRMRYEQWLYSLGITSGYRWTPSLGIVTLRGGFTFSVIQNFYDADIFRPADRDIRDKHGMWGWNNTFWTRLSVDTRDLNYDPSRGWFVSEQITFNGIIPTIETEYFIRSDTKLEKYFTLLDYPLTQTWNLKFVLAAYSGLSFQVPLPDSMVTDNSKLYIDGMFTGRGWTNLYSKASARGSLMINHWLEIRMPIAPGIVSADFFFDAVAIKPELDDLPDLTMDDYYFSFGPGIRFTIPQFPLHLLFANTFRVLDGNVEWSDGSGPNWKFVLSFNIANL